jgi:hypothetical protein
LLTVFPFPGYNYPMTTMQTGADFDKGVKSAVSAIRRALEAVAGGDKDALSRVTKATDRAYRCARFSTSPEASYAAIEGARKGLETALDAGYEARRAVNNAEIQRLKEEVRRARAATDWMVR